MPSIIEGILLGYGRFAIKDRPYPGIVEHEQGQVVGHVLVIDCDYENVVKRLDMYEGDEYIRKEVEIITSGGIIKCLTYVYTAAGITHDPWVKPE